MWPGIRSKTFSATATEWHLSSCVKTIKTCRFIHTIISFLSCAVKVFWNTQTDVMYDEKQFRIIFKIQMKFKFSHKHIFRSKNCLNNDIFMVHSSKHTQTHKNVNENGFRKSIWRRNEMFKHTFYHKLSLSYCVNLQL